MGYALGARRRAGKHLDCVPRRSNPWNSVSVSVGSVDFVGPMRDVVSFRTAGTGRAAASRLVRRLASCFKLPVRKAPIGPDVMASVAVRDALEIVLVFGLRFPEFRCGLYFGHYLSGPKTRSVNVRDRLLRNPLLFFGCVENGGAVAGSDVISLAVLRRRIVNLEKEFQQLPITQLLWIEDDFDRLGMAFVVAIRCVRNVASGVADPRGDHAWTAAQQILHAPEAAARENCPFLFLR